MFATITAVIAKNVLLGWLWRRVQEIVSWAFGLVPLFLALPPGHQEMILGILKGQGGGYSLSAYAGFAYYLYTQWQSLRATTKPQIVDGEGTKRELPPISKEEALDLARQATGREHEFVGRRP